MVRGTLMMVGIGLVVLISAVPASGQGDQQGWISLFNGANLDGWKMAERENPRTFSVKDGAIVANGPRNHLFYIGPVHFADFRDFELKVEVRTEPNSNGGIYFHTQYQDRNWPDRGFEVQVCNDSYRRDARKTGSLYKMQDINPSPANDREWFTMHVIVRGKHVVVNVNDKQVVDWTEPEKANPPSDMPGRRIDSGAFALQGHDPGSTVYYKNIRVNPLFPIADYHVHLKGGLTIDDAVKFADEHAIGIGVAENCGIGMPVTDDAGLQRFLDKLEGKPAIMLAGKPVYRAMQAEGREWVKMFSPEVIAKFDYVFTDSMTWTNDQGKRMRLWIPAEVEVGDKQAFMDMLVARTVGILNDEPIDIYVNPTFLPAEIAGEYDTLWTDARMDRVIDAAVKNGVAIEINARYKIPSEKFLRKAKAAGAKFAFGTNNGDKDLGDLAYSRLMAKRLALTADDLFTPKPAGQKPIQRRGLPPR
ncbi:MAG: hypothetical protein A2Y77_16215 [Planctomycetes bacterium RBG_13_62_9]|nr:MAG: hypothetical protein A2Y77_16215 [Planctomycetes bacterium RBG_13_62_9]